MRAKPASNSALCAPAILGAFGNEGEQKEKMAKEARENLKTLESGLEGKRFFGGEEIGFTDIAAGWMGIWVQIVEELAGVKLIDEETMPLLAARFKAVIETPILKEFLPSWDKLIALNREVRWMMLPAST